MKSATRILISGLFLSVVFFGNYAVARADFSLPYVVDDKPQVLFGDSINIDGHFGLENFTQDYVNGYAHVLFTYTHASDNYASSPPTIFVTDVDPRLSYTISKKYTEVATRNMTTNQSPTDWYLFDIQFDASGYRTIIKERGTVETFNVYTSIDNIAKTDWISIANYYPTYGVPIVYSMAFTPFPLTSGEPSGNSNVLFIPGLEASRLYEQKTVLGVPVEDQLWEPNLPSDVDDLYLDTNGVSINKIYTRNVIDITNSIPLINFNIYKSLILNLDNLKSVNLINDWKTYAYDWRQGVDDLIQNGTQYSNGQIVSLIDTLQSLVDTSKSGKVTIITHSNGGLIAKDLIKKLQDMKSSGQSDLIDHIDNLIMVAAPQIGTPDAFSSILHGYKGALPIGLMSDIQARKLAQNMPSAYGLLPSKKYFDQASIKPLAVFASTSAQMYQTAYGTDITNYSEEHNFVLGHEGRAQAADSDLISPLIGNNLLLTQAESLHDVIDNMTIPASIKVIDIAGWGKETIAGITYTGTDIQPIFTVRGDETVVSASALYGQGDKYWLDLTNSTLGHKNIMEDTQLLGFLDNVIEKQPISASNINSVEPTQNGNRVHLGVHSPVSIGVYDSHGNFTGKVCDGATGNCVTQENIPGSTYYEFGEGKYVNLGEGNLQKAVLQGTDAGTFTFDSQVVTPNGQTTNSSFVDIPVTTQTQAEITIDQTTNIPQLKLDVTGDGVTDFTLAPSSTFDPVTYLQIMKATVDSLDVTDAKKKAFDTRVDNIIKSIQKGKIDKAKLKADRFVTVLQNKLAKPDPKKPRPKKLSKTDAQTLLDMLNQLLDNIG